MIQSLSSAIATIMVDHLRPRHFLTIALYATFQYFMPWSTTLQILYAIGRSPGRGEGACWRWRLGDQNTNNCCCWVGGVNFIKMITIMDRFSQPWSMKIYQLSSFMVLISGYWWISISLIKYHLPGSCQERCRLPAGRRFLCRAHCTGSISN